MKYSVILFVIITVFCISCAAKVESPKRNYKVSVQANGKKQSGDTPQLINRVNLTHKQILEFFGNSNSSKIPFQLVPPSKATKFNPAFSIQNENKITTILGLKKGDVIHSVEGKLIRDSNDLKVFAKFLNTLKEVGVTYQRKNQIMKILLYPEE